MSDVASSTPSTPSSTPAPSSGASVGSVVPVSSSSPAAPASSAPAVPAPAKPTALGDVFDALKADLKSITAWAPHIWTEIENTVEKHKAGTAPKG